MPAESCKVNVDRVDAAVLLLFTQILSSGTAVEGRRKGGASRTAIAKYARCIRILKNTIMWVESEQFCGKGVQAILRCQL